MLALAALPLALGLGCAPARDANVQVTRALSGPRGHSGDKIADVEVGQRDFTELAPREIVNDKLNDPGGVVVDRAVWPGRAYIWDAGNSRILGIDLSRCYARPVGQRCAADIVIGQTSAFDHGACNGDSSVQQYPLRPPASASTLCGIYERTTTVLEDKSFSNMFVDQNSNLYVPDVENNRVLKYISPFTSDVVADEVWGQPDFVQNGCNGGTDPNNPPAPTASTLCLARKPFPGGFGGGVRIDPSQNVWITDGGNHRVLRFPRLGNGTISKTANLVLGQPDFTSFFPGNGMNQFNTPQQILFDGSWNLYVADAANDRILVFQRDPSTGDFRSGASAVRSFTTAELFGPQTVEMDPDSRGIWTVGNNAGGVPQLFDFSGNLLTAPGTVGFFWNVGGSIAFDGQRNLLVSSYTWGQDLSRYVRSPDGSSYTQDRQFFSPPGPGFPGFYNLASSRRFEHPAGGGVAVSGAQLLVSDGRLLFWNNTATLTNGQAPDGFASVNGSTITDPVGFDQIKVANNQVWASRGSEIRIYPAPLVNGANPTKILTSVPVMNSSAVIDFSAIGVSGLAPTSDGAFLWVSQRNASRVVRIKGPLGASPVVDVVLGQTDAVGTQCNRGIVPPPNQLPPNNADRSMLCLPGAISIDRKGNLYVSDSSVESQGNWRMLMFAPSLFTTTPKYAPFATKEFPRHSVPTGGEFMTFEPAFDSNNHMVVGIDPNFGPRFLLYYNDPTTVNPSNPSDPAFAAPSGQFEDFTGWVMANTFDATNNLYSFDANRGKVSIYFKPFGS
jgi:hypothetical protein